MGMFLVGAYQEILGDLHNLFGDTDAVHVRLEEDGSYRVDHVVEGDSVDDVLHYGAVRTPRPDREGPPHHRGGAAPRPHQPRGVGAPAPPLPAGPGGVHLSLPRTTEGSDTLRIVSWNVNGLRACAKKGFGRWLGRCRAEVVGLQEVRALEAQLPDTVRAPRGWHTSFSPAERLGYSGVGLYSRRKPTRWRRAWARRASTSRGVCRSPASVAWSWPTPTFPRAAGASATTAGCPTSSPSTQALFERIQRLRKRGYRVLVTGRLQHRAPRDRSRAPQGPTRTSSGFLPEERAELDRWVAAGWTDTFRRYEPGPAHYSWWSQRSGGPPAQHRLAHRLRAGLARGPAPRARRLHPAAGEGLGPLPGGRGGRSVDLRVSVPRRARRGSGDPRRHRGPCDRPPRGPAPAGRGCPAGRPPSPPRRDRA